MRELTVVEVDVGCDACSAMRSTPLVDTAFVAGVALGLVRDQFSFCADHLAGFKRATKGLGAQPGVAPTGSKSE